MLFISKGHNWWNNISVELCIVKNHKKASSSEIFKPWWVSKHFLFEKVKIIQYVISLKIFTKLYPDFLLFNTLFRLLYNFPPCAYWQHHAKRVSKWQISQLCQCAGDIFSQIEGHYLKWSHKFSCSRIFLHATAAAPN